MIRRIALLPLAICLTQPVRAEQHRSLEQDVAALGHRLHDMRAAEQPTRRLLDRIAVVRNSILAGDEPGLNRGANDAVLRGRLGQLQGALNELERIAPAQESTSVKAARQRLETAARGTSRQMRDAVARELHFSKQEGAAARASSIRVGRVDSSAAWKDAAAVLNTRVLSTTAVAPSPEGPPTPADTAETKIVQLTPEIRALANDLGNSPSRMFAFVHDNVAFEPYFGATQNSQAVLWSRRGNNADTATLLVALLRASGIPARYGGGFLLIPPEDVARWLGVADTATAAAIAHGAFLAPAGSPLKCFQFWVVAYLDTPQGKQWIRLDPSLKLPQLIPGVSLPRLPFDRNAYLAQVRSALPSEAYLDQLSAYLRANVPGKSLSDAVPSSRLDPADDSSLPAAPSYPMGDVIASQTDLAGLSQTVTVSLERKDGTSLWQKQFAIPEIGLQGLTVSYAGPVLAGGQATPELRLDDQVVATASGSVAVGSVVNLRIQYSLPLVTPSFNDFSEIIVGEEAAIAIDNGQVTEQLLRARIDRTLTSIASQPQDSARVIRETLHVAGLRYLQRYRAETDRLAGPLQIKIVRGLGQFCVTTGTLTAQVVADRPFLVTPSQFDLDALGLDTEVWDPGLNPLTADQRKNFIQLQLLTGSALEHQLWEEIALTPSISTAKALAYANETKIPLVSLSPSAAPAAIANFTLPQELKNALLAEAKAGKTLLTPDRLVQYLDWNGLAYIAEFPDGSGTYAIFRLIKANGGFTATTTTTPTRLLADSSGVPYTTNGTSLFDPVTVSSGNLFQQAIDLSYSSRGFPVAVRRTYNSLTANTAGPFGFGWTHIYRASLQDNQTSVAMVDDSGGTFAFTLQGTAYISPPGLNLTLTKDAQGYTVRNRYGSQKRFDTKGVLQSTDRNQNTVSLSYDSSVRLARVTDALGRGLTWNYDGQGRVASVQDFSGRKVSYQYDQLSNLIAVTDAAGNTTAYSYYSDRVFSHLLQTVTTPNGNITTFTYYSNGKVEHIDDAGGGGTGFFYLPLRNETVLIDRRGLSWSYYYNSLGNVTRIAKPDGNCLDTTYTADAKLASRTDEGGNVTTYTYDTSGNLTLVTDPLGGTLYMTYEPGFNQVLTITNPNGNVTKFAYDAHGNVVDVQRPLGVEYKFTYDASGDPLSLTDGEGNTATITYDSSGNAVQLTDPSGNSTKVAYDTLRRATSVVDALNGQVRFDYDFLDRVTRLVDKLGNAATISYDGDSNATQATDFNGASSSYSYDALDNLTGVTDPLMNTTQYVYSTAACNCNTGWDLQGFRDAAGTSHAYSYDGNELLVQTTGPGAAAFSYDARGNLAQKTDSNGNTIGFEYDAAGRLVRKALPAGTDARFTYDAAGNLTGAANAAVTLTFTYDALNRLASANDSRFGKTIRYTYNRNGQRTTRTDSEGGTTTYTYDTNGRLASITAPSAASVQLTYDALNRRTGLVNSNGAVTTYQYDAAGHMTALGTSVYSYDRNGNLAAMSDANGTHSFQYDALNRLTVANHPTGAPENYAYDGAGNRTSSATDTNYIYDGASHLVAAEGFTYTYDQNGNLFRRNGPNGTTGFTYNFDNQLVRIDFPDGTSAAYKYDALGRRIEKNVNGAVTTFLYDGTNLLLEMDGNGALKARYTHGGGVDEPLFMERGGQSYFYQADRTGSIVRLTDGSGNPVCSYTYNSYGNTQVCAAVANPFAFSAREFDAESGLYYLRARYYDPVVGRFLTSDPLDVTGQVLARQGSTQGLIPAASAALAGYGGPAGRLAPQLLNPYAYAAGNPLNLSDPSGLIPQSISKTPLPILTTPLVPPGPPDSGGISASGGLITAVGAGLGSQLSQQGFRQAGGAAARAGTGAVVQQAERTVVQQAGQTALRSGLIETIGGYLASGLLAATGVEVTAVEALVIVGGGGAVVAGGVFGAYVIASVIYEEIYFRQNGFHSATYWK